MHTHVAGPALHGPENAHDAPGAMEQRDDRRPSVPFGHSQPPGNSPGVGEHPGMGEQRPFGKAGSAGSVLEGRDRIRRNLGKRGIAPRTPGNQAIVRMRVAFVERDQRS